MNVDEIVKLLEVNIPNEKININEPMYKHTTFKIGGNADVFVNISSIEELMSLLNVTTKYNIKLTVIGNGSNLLVKDEGIKGIVAKMNIDDYSIEKKDECAIISVGAGMLNSKLAMILLSEELQGFEFASGIPGTIGGAIRMNAGAYESEMKDGICETTYIDIDDKCKIKKLSKLEQKFDYRYSIFQEMNAIIISAKFKFYYGEKEEIFKKMQDNLNSRKEKQPTNFPSAGSIFKRGEDFTTAKLIDECGLKGMKIGGAEISTKHAGFIINTGNATAKDVLQLIEIVKEEVYRKFNKQIKLEIEVIGE